MNRSIAKVALVAATAMTISLASPVTAQAKESSGSATLAPAAAQSATKAQPTAVTTASSVPVITRLKVGSGVLYYKGTTYIPSNVQFVVPSGYSIIPTARVTVNGRVRGSISLYNGSSVGYPSSWGRGVVKLDNIVFKRYDSGTPYLSPATTTFRVRQGLYSGGGLRIVRKGSKMTFKVQKVRAFTGTRYYGLKKARVQVRKGGKWRTLKNVRLNRAGNKTFKIKKKGKAVYRLYIPTTAAVKGGATRGIKI